MKPKSEVFNVDCLDYMRGLPDNAFELAIADPPYGDAGSGTLVGVNGSASDSTGINKIPPQEENALCVRCSKEQQDLPGPEEHGHRNTQKNCRLG
jgi:DNA modification methylase